jgi:hypothetical protein
MKTYGRVEVFIILDLRIRWVSDVRCKTRPFYFRGESPHYSSGRPQSRHGRCGNNKNILPLLDIKPLPSSPRVYGLRNPGFLVCQQDDLQSAHITHSISHPTPTIREPQLRSQFSDWLRAGRPRGWEFPVGSRIFTSPCLPDRLWGPSSLISNGYRGPFHQG